MDISEDLELLDQEIRKLKIDFDRFFNGALATPPDELRQSVFATVRRFRKRRITTVAERFRLNSLEARLNTLNELFNRRLREHEESGGRRAESQAAASDLLFDTATPRDAVRALYNQLYEASGRKAITDLTAFHSFLRREARKIQAKTGCRLVRFRLDNDNGKVRLKARPLAITSTSSPKEG